ncbi:MAG TPA: methionine adenosyltransferase, partial [Methanomassiliicoccales archaeon]|nr:methionine adenosyltransferase [Methanomassiliicoccales archaeon]
MAKSVKSKPAVKKPAVKKVVKNIIVDAVDITPIEQQRVELVERKGIGHPDSISDGLAESVSRALCKMYLEYYGEILHHNTDQNEVVGGQSAPKFGGGRMLEPIYVLLVGRAITQVNGERLPFSTTAREAARQYLKRFPN